MLTNIGQILLLILAMIVAVVFWLPAMVYRWAEGVLEWDLYT